MNTTLRYKEKFTFNPLVKKNIMFISLDRKLVVENGTVILIEELTLEQIKNRYALWLKKKLDLSNKAYLILNYILKDAKRNADIAFIDMDNLMSITGYNSLGPVYAGLNELVEKNMIARTKYDDQYYINPNFIQYKTNDVDILNRFTNNKYIEVLKSEKTTATYDLPAGFDPAQKI